MPAEDALIVDCSHWNTRLDCTALAENGVAGVIVKATQGVSVLDPTCAARLQAARQAGLLTGAYHWLDPAQPAAQQVEFFFAHAASAQLLALDLEQYWSDWADRKNPRKRFSAKRIADRAMQWLTLVERLSGRRPLVYTGAWFVDEYLAGQAEWLRDYPLWIAAYIYPKTPPITCSWQAFRERYLPITRRPRLPKGCSTWALWQFTGDKFTLPGVSGRVDINLAGSALAGARPRNASLATHTAGTGTPQLP